MHDFETVALLH